MNKFKKWCLVGLAAFGIGAASVSAAPVVDVSPVVEISAFAQPAVSAFTAFTLQLATVDLSDVTGELSSLSTAVVAAAGTVITAALAVGAVFFGGRALWRFFKGLAR